MSSFGFVETLGLGFAVMSALFSPEPPESRLAEYYDDPTRVGIVLSLAGLLVPIPLMALDLLTGAVQAYIFATLALVFIGSAVTGDEGATPPPPQQDAP